MKALRLSLAALMAGFFLGCAIKRDEVEIVDQEAKVEAADYVYVDGGISTRIPRRIKIEDLSRATLRGNHPSKMVTDRNDIEEMLRHPMPASRGSAGSFP